MNKYNQGSDKIEKSEIASPYWDMCNEIMKWKIVSFHEIAPLKILNLQFLVILVLQVSIYFVFDFQF